MDHAHADRDGTGTITLDGEKHTVDGGDLDGARIAIMQLALQTAYDTKRDIELVVTANGTMTGLRIRPNWTVIEDRTLLARQHELMAPSPAVMLATTPPEPPDDRVVAERVEPEATAPSDDDWPDPGWLTPGRASIQPTRPVGIPRPTSPTGYEDEAPPPPLPEVTAPKRPGARRASVPPARGAEGRPTFITHGRSQPPASQGWRGALNRAVGTRLEADASESSRRADIKTVAQHWAGTRTVAVVNGKGSAGKTPTTICLAAVFAREGGSGVLAWDNNETRGSLPWRVDSSPHEATVLDLLPRIQELLQTHAPYAELNHFVHHQPADKFAALFSDQSVAGDHIVSEDEVRRIHDLAARYYRLIIIDSGNNERAPNWRAMIDHASRLVVPVTNLEDTAEAAARMLEALTARGGRSADLARDALIVLSHRSPGRDPHTARIVDGFVRLGHDVVTIPYDPALRTGVIHFDALREPTQRAWLRAAAAVAANLPADPSAPAG